MRWTRHAAGQLHDRMVAHGITNRQEIESAISEHGKYFGRETHVVVKRLPRQVHLSDGSNGDVVLAVVNGENIVTLMLRRNSQLRRHHKSASRPPVIGG